MNEEIRNIVRGYMSDGDYEKAYSLLINLPLIDEADQTLLKSCKTNFITSCTYAITTAVEANDKQKAESILSSYKKLIGEDANSKLFQTLVDNITKDKTSQQFFSTTNINSLFDNCAPSQTFLESKVMWGSYIFFAAVAILCGSIFLANIMYCVASILVALALAIPTIESGNNRFKPIGLILLLIPTIFTVVNFGKGLPADSSSRTITWLTSFTYIIVFNSLCSKKSWRFRAIVSLLLFTILNPLWYSFSFTPGVKIYVKGYSLTRYYQAFSPYANVWIALAAIITITIYYTCFISLDIKKFIKSIDYTKYFNLINKNKKQLGIIIGSILGVILIIVVGLNVKDHHDREIAYQQAIEQARLDSIQAEEDMRLAAIERARQDSIAAVRRREQARRDSIDYVEHAGFVKKYANIGLIITELEMTRGENNDIATKGIKFSVFNPTHKTIKYVIANLHAVNKFSDRITENRRCRGMGPIDSHDYGSWDFDDVFDDKNDVIDDLSVSFQVIYTNGSSKMIRWKDAYVSDFKPSWFYNR